MAHLPVPDPPTEIESPEQCAEAIAAALRLVQSLRNAESELATRERALARSEREHISLSDAWAFLQILRATESMAALTESLRKTLTSRLGEAASDLRMQIHELDEYLSHIERPGTGTLSLHKSAAGLAQALAPRASVTATLARLTERSRNTRFADVTPSIADGPAQPPLPSSRST